MWNAKEKSKNVGTRERKGPQERAPISGTTYSTVIRFKKKISMCRLALYEQRMSKKLGSYHSKSHFIGLQKSLLELIFSLEWDFEDFLSDKTQILLTFSGHKGLIYT